MINKFQRHLSALEDGRLWCFYASMVFLAFTVISLLSLGDAQSKGVDTFTPSVCMTVGITGIVFAVCAYLLISHLADNYQNLFYEELVEKEEEHEEKELEVDFYFEIEGFGQRSQIPHVIDILKQQIQRLEELAEEKMEEEEA